MQLKEKKLESFFGCYKSFFRGGKSEIFLGLVPFFFEG